MKFFSFTAVVGLLGAAVSAQGGRNPNDIAQYAFGGPGLYFLESVATGTVVDLAGGRREDGTPVIGWTRHGGRNQQWQVADAGNNEFLFLNVASGTYLTANERPTDGLIRTTGNLISPATSRARWTISPGGTRGSSIIHNVADRSKVLDLAGSNSANGTPIIIYQEHGGRNQQWRFNRV